MTNTAPLDLTWCCPSSRADGCGASFPKKNDPGPCARCHRLLELTSQGETDVDQILSAVSSCFACTACKYIGTQVFYSMHNAKHVALLERASGVTFAEGAS